MRPVVAVAVLVVSMLAWPALAQDANAPDPSASNNVVYAASNSAADRALGWLSTDDTAGSTGTVGGTVPEDCIVDQAAGQGLPSPVCEAADMDWTWTFTLSPALRAPLAINGPVHMIAHLGAGTGSGTGLEVTAQLKHGDTVLADGPMQEYEYTASPTGENYDTVEWTVPAQGTVPAGATLVWTVRVVGAAGEPQDNLFMAVGEPRGRSRIILPGEGSGADPIQAINATAVDIQRTYNESTDALLRFTWTGPATSVALEHTTAGTGNVTFVVLDGANATLLNASVSGFKADRVVKTGAAGNWSIGITLVDFNGTLRLTINDPGVVPPAPTNPALSKVTSTSTKGSGNGTGNATDGEEDKGAPAPAFPAVVAALAAAVAVLRRRRQG